MDSLTQAVLGAALQGSLLGKVQGRKALLYGAALGTLPDLDVLINFGDAVAQMTYHRGFSHSIFIFSAVALLLTWLIRCVKPNPDYSAVKLFGCIWLVLFTHVLIDACTTYGTQLFWPIPWTPLNFSNIFVIDPLYTLPLLLGVVFAAVRGLGARGLRVLNIGLAVSSLYLASSVLNQSLMRATLERELAAQQVPYDELLLMPTPFNTLAWRVLLRQGDQYSEGIRSWLDEAPVALYARPFGHQLRAVLAASPQHARLRWFSGDWLSYREAHGQLVVTDLRIGLAGAQPFQFALAERDVQGAWQLKAQAVQLPSNRGTEQTRALLLKRILGQSVELAELHQP